MTNKDLTFIAGIIDRSGSMAHIADDTAGGWNTLVAEQAKQPGQCQVMLTEFDSICEIVHELVDAKDAPSYFLRARGNTALRDAIGKTVTELGQKLAALPEDERPATVIVPILTDGHENASEEWSAKDVKALIEQQTEVYGWIFQFMGANQDAILTAKGIGIRSAHAVTYDTHNVGSAYASTSSNIARSRSMAATGASAEAVSDCATYTDDQRSAAIVTPHA